MPLLKGYTSRSATLTHQQCPRKYYLDYKVPTSNPTGIGGIRPVRLDMNLHVGTCYHEGMERVNKGASVEEAVGQALEKYWPALQAQGYILEPGEDASYVAYEQAALVEALVRGYVLAVLPGNLNRFDIVEAEREEIGIFSHGGFELTFGARLDGLLLERHSQDLYVQSFKTTKEWGKKSDDMARHDMQGLSETAVVDQRLEKWHEHLSRDPAKIEEEFNQGCNHWTYPDASIPRWFVARYLTGAAPYVMGVKMEFALKGRRSESPKGSGRYVYSNPLIRPWKKADDLKTFGGKAGNYAFKYDFQDELGGNHRLGKGWNSVNIWEDMGVKNWIELLASESLQGFPPGTALTNQFVTPGEYYRNEDDIARWKRQIVHHELRVTESSAKVANLLAMGTLDEIEAGLDEHFEQRTRSCDWPTKCVYQPICYGPRPYLVAPESSGLYTIREANHPSEVDFNA